MSEDIAQHVGKYACNVLDRVVMRGDNTYITVQCPLCGLTKEYNGSMKDDEVSGKGAYVECDGAVISRYVERCKSLMVTE